jgi:signal peptidase
MALIGWKEGVGEKPRLSSVIPISGALAGSFHVAVFMIVGLVYGFGRSPYSHQPSAVAGNLIYVASFLIAVELSRACILGSLGARKPYLALAACSIFFALLDLPATWPSSFDSPAASFRFIGGTLLPGISENLLASFLALAGGPLASLIYRGLLHGFEWTSPILPNLDWMVEAFVGTIAPALGLVLLRSTLLSITDDEPQQAEQEERVSTSWVAVAVTAVAMLWFNSGMLGYRPTIVNGVSMDPALKPGDLVVIRDVDEDSIRVGDIIQFRRSGAFILHRVVEVANLPGGFVYTTRGDANNVDDEPVYETDVEGKIVAVVPKLGWIGILPRLLFDRLGGQP